MKVSISLLNLGQSLLDSFYMKRGEPTRKQLQDDIDLVVIQRDEFIDRLNEIRDYVLDQRASLSPGQRTSMPLSMVNYLVNKTDGAHRWRSSAIIGLIPTWDEEDENSAP